MFEGFVNPGLVIGTSLAAVPLLIHLLNRQRHRPMAWGAMRFVIAAYRKTRRRVQLENLLLLLLRMGVIALLALCVARPFAGGGGSLGPLTEARQDVLLVVDASASTSYREDVETVFERSLRRATALLEELDGPRGDRAQLIVMGNSPRALGWGDPSKALTLLATLSPSAERADLAAALGKVLAICEENAAGTGSAHVQVRILCDLQQDLFASLRGALSAEDSSVNLGGEQEGAGLAARPLARQHLDRLHELGVRVLVEDHGPSPSIPANLSIQSVRTLNRPIGEKARVQVAVRVANHGTSPRPAERVSLSVNGNKLPIVQVDLPARGQAEALFSFQVKTPGAQALLAQLEGDRLAADDRRAAIIVVPPAISILVVNGAPSANLDEDEVGYLLLALEPLRVGDGPGNTLNAPFAAREITPADLLAPSLDLREYDVILLAGVASLPEVTVKALTERVASGASLVFAMGSRLADLEGTNERLFRADGSGLLPAELVQRRSTSRRGRYWRVAEFEETHPVLRFFAEERWKPLLTEVPVYSFVETRPLEDARVLARLDDEARSPLLIERSFDQGRVYLWTTSFQREWSDIVTSPNTLVPLMHEWMVHAGSRDEGPRETRPGEPLALVLNGFPRAPLLVRPDGTTRPMTAEPLQQADGRWRLAALTPADTALPGLYKVRLEGAPAEPFAVALDPLESELERISPVVLNSLHPALALTGSGGKTTGDTQLTPRRGEVWRILALAALVFLVAESIWGARLGRRRRVVA
jgi:hypothetical protein